MTSYQNQGHKKISLLSAVALASTAMIGSGWLFSAQLNAKLAGNYAFLAWFLAAVLVVTIGLCLSQVVTVYPVRGATTRSSALSHNSIFGMPFAFANWFGLMVAVATEAQATTEYLTACIKDSGLVNNDGLTLRGKLFALFILFLYLVINFYGVKVLSKVNNVVTALKIFTPIFAIVVLLIARFDKTNFTFLSGTVYTIGSAFSAMVGAGLIYSYNGFQLAAAFASEIEKPKRNVPLSMVISIFVVMLVYMALQLAFMGAVPHDLIQATGWQSLNFHSPLINLAFLLGLNFLALLLTADSVISPSGTGYAYLGGSARMFYAMALEGQMPKWTIAKLNPIYNLCRRSLLINWILIALVLWNSKNWASLMLVVTGYNVIGYMAAPVSMGALKPKTRFLGCLVFVALSLIINTLPHHDLAVLNFSIMALMLIYGAIQLTKKVNALVLLTLISPFIIFLWLVYAFSENLVLLGCIAVVFYFLITHTRFVAFCKKHKSEETSLSFDEDFVH